MYIVLKYLFFEVYPELLYSNVKKFLLTTTLKSEN